jgi:putative ABC transport system permease protein
MKHVFEGKTMSSKKKTPKKEQKPRITAEVKIGSIKFPIGEAFRFSLESIRKRFTRALITASSVLLGIAFMVAVLTMGNIMLTSQQAQTWMAIIALLVCGVGIVNSMLMSVTERYKEIGTMKCLGATDTNVLEIFLLEALLLGLLGGAIGACLGWVFITAILAKLVVSTLFYVGIGIATAGLLSVAAAAYPAVYAARLNPAEALRYEV